MINVLLYCVPVIALQMLSHFQTPSTAIPQLRLSSSPLSTDSERFLCHLQWYRLDMSRGGYKTLSFLSQFSTLALLDCREERKGISLKDLWGFVESSSILFYCYNHSSSLGKSRQAGWHFFVKYFMTAPLFQREHVSAAFVMQLFYMRTRIMLWIYIP